MLVIASEIVFLRILFEGRKRDTNNLSFVGFKNWHVKMR